jgi:hypothetical protein
MTAPNINAPKQVTGRTFAQPLVKAQPLLLENPADSGQVWRISTVLIHNISATTSAIITLYLQRYGSGATHFLHSKTVAPGVDLEVTNRNNAYYLEEGDGIAMILDKDFILDVMITYEIIGEPTP